MVRGATPVQPLTVGVRVGAVRGHVRESGAAYVGERIVHVLPVCTVVRVLLDSQSPLLAGFLALERVLLERRLVVVALWPLDLL